MDLIGAWILASALLVCGLPLVLLLYVVVNPWNRWQCHHIPGYPWRPVVGNLREISAKGFHNILSEGATKYGKVFKVWFGVRPWVVVADADAHRHISFKLLNRPAALGPSLASPPLRKPANHGLFFARDQMWRLLHRAWQPAFYPDSVAHYAPLMLDCVERLCQQLVVSAETEEPLDIWRQVGDMTMAVVGTTAFGIDFRTLAKPSDEGPHSTEPQQQPTVQQQQQRNKQDLEVIRALVEERPLPAAWPLQQWTEQRGRELVAGAKTLFGSTAAGNQSTYVRLGFLMPLWLRPALTWLAYHLPDERFEQLRLARQKVTLASAYLIQTAKATASSQYAPMGSAADTADGQCAVNAVNDNGSEVNVRGLVNSQRAVANTAGAGGALGSAAKGRGPVAAGSFLDLMLTAAAAAAASGEFHLTDLSVAMQTNTFLLAGYETTANALAYTIFCVAVHPEAEQTLVAELQAAGGKLDAVHPAELAQQFPYACGVVDEALRLFPPGANTMREVVPGGPFTVLGYNVPPGSTLCLAGRVVQCSSEYWERPLEFLPERWLPGHEHLACRNPHAYVPFGAGARMCVGYRFALQELRLALLRLYKQYSFAVHWPSMAQHRGQVPGMEQAMTGAGALQRLRLVTGLTMSPAGGVWVTVRRR